ncbi:MAG: EscN/YscN/HrcN family type III secretion system ATPase [Blastopirellula sp.]|nr:EscN/YscN/HrcN family type III secretion system ATPase [Blastopirellula sp.]
MNALDFDRLEYAAGRVRQFQTVGALHSAQGAITATIPAGIGQLCRVEGRDGRKSLAEVIGFNGEYVQIMPFSHQTNLQRGDRVTDLIRPFEIPVGAGLLGRVINCLGEPIDNLGPLRQVRSIPLQVNAPPPMSRQPIEKTFVTGQKAIDSLLTLGVGQRVGLMAGSGVGKSTLLGEIAKFASADLNVVALIGERGREVLPFIKDSLGEAGLRRSVVVVSLADETPLARVRAGETAVAIADSFRAAGKQVLLMFDSLTRWAMAQRELGLMLNEPPTARGYTPSVFQKLAVLLEQLGAGHIVLNRALANAGHFPAIDVLASISRLFLEITDKNQQAQARTVRQVLATYREVLDLLQVGAYQKGAVAATDRAIEAYPKVQAFLRQAVNQPVSWKESQLQLAKLAKLCGMA